VWIEGVNGPISLSVGEAVDVALTHDAFAAWVKERIRRRDHWQAITVLDPATGAWQIGLAQHPTGDTRIVVVDSVTGTTGAYLRAKTDGGGGFKILGPAD
jgi:hypothetical protein